MGRAGYGKYPPQSYTWALRPAAADWAGEIIRITDVGVIGSYWISDGTRWTLLNGSVVLAQSATPVAVPANTDEATLATISIKGGMMGISGALRVLALFSETASANAKTHRVKLGATTFASLVVTAGTVVTAGLWPCIYNRQAANSQVCHPSGAVVGTSAAAVVTGTIDTSADADLTITGQKASGAETLSLQAYTVELLTL